MKDYCATNLVLLCSLIRIKTKLGSKKKKSIKIKNDIVNKIIYKFWGRELYRNLENEWLLDLNGCF